MLVSGEQWPVFLYHCYDYDGEDPWKGLFRSVILVSVRFFSSNMLSFRLISLNMSGLQICLYVAELRPEGTQSNPFWERSYSWDDTRDPALDRLHCYSGETHVFVQLHI
jgi:hypothetical protein